MVTMERKTGKPENQSGAEAEVIKFRREKPGGGGAKRRAFSTIMPSHSRSPSSGRGAKSKVTVCEPSHCASRNSSPILERPVPNQVYVQLDKGLRTAFF